MGGKECLVSVRVPRELCRYERQLGLQVHALLVTGRAVRGIHPFLRMGLTWYRIDLGAWNSNKSGSYRAPLPLQEVWHVWDGTYPWMDVLDPIEIHPCIYPR